MSKPVGPGPLVACSLQPSRLSLAGQLQSPRRRLATNTHVARRSKGITEAPKKDRPPAPGGVPSPTYPPLTATPVWDPYGTSPPAWYIMY